MQTEKMVIRFKDKTLMKGITSDFSPRKSIFNLKLLNGEIVKVDMDKLKAAFLVKTFSGNKEYTYAYKDVLPWGGNKVKVEFNDGEVMIGYVSHHLSNNQNFYITPADLRGNNKQAFVIASSTKDIMYL